MAAARIRSRANPLDRHPVESVSWLDAVKFCNKLSEMEGARKSVLRDRRREAVQVLDWNGPGLSAADRGGMGIRLPGEDEDSVLRSATIRG